MTLAESLKKGVVTFLKKLESIGYFNNLDSILRTTVQLDLTTVNDEHIFYDFEEFNKFTLKMDGASGAGTARVSVQGDMSSDQTGVYTNKIGLLSIPASPNNTLANIDFAPNSSYTTKDLSAFSALRVYVSVADATASPAYQIPTIAERKRG